MSAPELLIGDEALNCGIQKFLIYAGNKKIEYKNGTKIYFHYKTLLKSDQSVIDDSRQSSSCSGAPPVPMELIVGKKFKLEVWEKALCTMQLNEVARFSVDRYLCPDYPLVAKQLREFYNSKHKGHDHHNHHTTAPTPATNSHCCGFNFIEQGGTGHSDLDTLLKAPQDLDFVFEVVKVEHEGAYEKESWILTDAERLQRVPELKAEANDLFKKNEMTLASTKYQEALYSLDLLMNKEQPHGEEWTRMSTQLKQPIQFNLSLCKFKLNEMYECIGLCTEVLEADDQNVKARYRRGLAHMAVGNWQLAIDDFQKCVEMQPQLATDVSAHLLNIKEGQRKKNQEDLNKFKGKLFS